MESYIIGETAYNHEGDFEYLKRMIVDIGEIPLNAIKFHLLLESSSCFQKKHPLAEGIKKWMFSREQWDDLIQFSHEKKLGVIALCDDIESIQFINESHRDIKAIELHATSLNEYYMLREAIKFPNQIILGIGGSTLDEIAYAVDFLKENGKKDILLMYGFQAYPTDYKDIHLSKMLKIKDLFNLAIGYADHTAYDDENNVDISALGAAMGFHILEKHYTPEFGVKRVDYHTAVGKEEMIRIKKKMDLYLNVFGGDLLRMSDREIQYGNIGPMKKAVVAKKDIHKGEKIRLEHLCFKRTEEESTIYQRDFTDLIGLEVLVDIHEDEIVDFTKVQYRFNKARYSELTGGLEEKK
ncbi:N-acetylneuraminate synthase family protein [Anaerosolibacter sp.]|uniref:N-acetylneuraminate synthase family protein n=1 Tax=Anaerosolibacter sp. TaxID=1872527 RepID=UPI0039EEC226